MLLLFFVIFTYRVSRRRREMYCGSARLWVFLSVCPRPRSGEAGDDGWRWLAVWFQ